MSYHLVVLGATGQLGRCLRMSAPDNWRENCRFFSRADLDLTDTAKIASFIADLKPQADVLINCAAYTNVEQAEIEPEPSRLINHLAVEQLARASADSGTWLIHISTDYVFGDHHNTPCKEQDDCRPLNVYGQHKRDGELAVLATEGASSIVRTSWLFSHYGNNFVTKILQLSRQKDRLEVVCDQIGAPTYARDLARALWTMVGAWSKPDRAEIWHYCNTGIISRYDFARAIIDLANSDCALSPITSDQRADRARHPPYSALDHTRIKQNYALDIPYWRDALSDCLQRMDRQTI